MLKLCHGSGKILLALSLAVGFSQMGFASDCVVPSDKSYRVGVNHDGYLVKVLAVSKDSSDEETCQDRTITFFAHFPFAEDQLTPQDKQEIKTLFGQWTARDTALSIQVTGYTDAVGSTAYNQQLGMRRARSVQAYLQQLGVNSEQIVIASEGKASPVASNHTAQGRAENRRAVIQLVK